MKNPYDDVQFVVVLFSFDDTARSLAVSNS
jgi:hypothetical protein